jgi:hypothetical protein
MNIMVAFLALVSAGVFAVHIFDALRAGSQAAGPGFDVDGPVNDQFGRLRRVRLRTAMPAPAASIGGCTAAWGAEKQLASMPDADALH